MAFFFGVEKIFPKKKWGTRGDSHRGHPRNLQVGYGIRRQSWAYTIKLLGVVKQVGIFNVGKRPE